MNRLPYYVHRYVIEDDSTGAEMFVDTKSESVELRLKHLIVVLQESFPKGFTNIKCLGVIKIVPVDENERK